MKLLWICAAKRLGGAENTMLQLLGLLGREGLRVEVLCPRGALASAAAAEGLPVRAAPLGGALNVRAAFAVAVELRRSAPDAVLATTADEWVWTCLARPPRTRLVLIRFMMLPLPRRVQRLAARRADAVVAVSRAVERSLSHVPPEKLHLIRVPYRLPPRADVPSTDERMRQRQAMGLPADRPCIAFFGGLQPAKGIGDVLAAVALGPRLGATHVAVCGSALAADDSSTLRALADHHGLGERVHHLGRVEEVAPVMTAADAVVVATRSELGEAIPLTLLEAMACGTPACAYDVGGVAEAFGADGEAGRLARPDDPADLGRVLGEILADSESSRAMARRALERLRGQFDPEKTADRYRKLLTALPARLDSSRRRG